MSTISPVRSLTFVPMPMSDSDADGGMLLLSPVCVLATTRLTVRLWQPGDAPRLKEAIDASLDHLRPWMHWAAHEPSELPVIEERIRQFRDAFVTGRSLTAGIFPPDGAEVLGGAGFHARRGPGALEIGYWLRAGRTGRGIATETAAMLTRAAFEVFGAERVEIRCDPLNTASAAVPRRLGYRLAATLRGDTTTPDGRPRDTLVWEMARGEMSGTPVAEVRGEARDEDGNVIHRFLTRR